MKLNRLYLTLIIIFISVTSIGCNDKKETELKVKKDIAIEDLNTRTTIPIDIDLLKNNEPLLLGEYELEKNNFIVYSINSTGDGNINIGFTKEKEYNPDKLLVGYFGYTSTGVANDIFDLSSIKTITPGTYYLWISSYDGELKDIKGEALIAD